MAELQQLRSMRYSAPNELTLPKLRALLPSSPPRHNYGKVVMTEYTDRSLPHRPLCGLDCLVPLLRQKIDKSVDGTALPRIHFGRSQILGLAELRQRLLNLADRGQRCRQTALYVWEIGINGESLSVFLDSCLGDLLIENAQPNAKWAHASCSSQSTAFCAASKASGTVLRRGFRP